MDFTRKVRELPFTHPYRIGVIHQVDTTTLLRFCAGIVYNYALTSPSKGRISLSEHHLEESRAFCMGETAKPPRSLNALVMRPIRFPLDNGMFAYRAPSPDEQHGFEGFRMMMGGVLFFVHLGDQSIAKHPAKEQFIKNRDVATPIVCVNAHDFEEYPQPKAWIESGWLSDALDRIEATARRS